jgi:hypothetical protein
LRRGHANLLCIVTILVYVLPKQAHLNKNVGSFEGGGGCQFIPKKFFLVIIWETCANNLDAKQHSEATKMWNASRFCVSSLRRGHANLLCIVPILVYVLPKQAH